MQRNIVLGYCNDERVNRPTHLKLCTNHSVYHSKGNCFTNPDNRPKTALYCFDDIVCGLGSTNYSHRSKVSYMDKMS